MEKFPNLLALCEGHLSVTGEFSSQRPVTCSFDVFFDLRLNGTPVIWDAITLIMRSLQWHRYTRPWHIFFFTIHNWNIACYLLSGMIKYRFDDKHRKSLHELETQINVTPSHIRHLSRLTVHGNSDRAPGLVLRIWISFAFGYSYKRRHSTFIGETFPWELYSLWFEWSMFWLV